MKLRSMHVTLEDDEC
jgi:Ca2+-binding EF-hand superfamily protein